MLEKLETGADAIVNNIPSTKTSYQKNTKNTSNVASYLKLMTKSVKDISHTNHNKQQLQQINKCAVPEEMNRNTIEIQKRMAMNNNNRQATMNSGY